MKNKPKKEKKRYLYIIFLALALVILLGTGAYAYYQTTISGTITGTVARWSFTANNQTSTFNLDFGSLYPGKTGTYNLELSAENSDLPVVFEVIYHYPDDVAAHTLLKPLCIPTEENPGCKWYDNFSMPSEYNALLVGHKGYILAGEKATIPIAYNWPYDGEDDESIADGRNVSLEVTIIGRQIDISNETTAVTSSYATDLLGLRTNSNCTTYNNYGYTCNIKFLDSLYLLGLDNGLIEGDIEAELEDWHPNILLPFSYLIVATDEKNDITLPDGGVLKLNKFVIAPILANLSE
ncbi:MAG: hypothetical protein IJB71_00790 [Bacilli bacterium]|nr:hypothetical protein [Bacilli bacterium]